MTRIACCVGLAAAAICVAAPTGAGLIVPGKQLGKVTIGPSVKWLNGPNYGDTASGHRWQTWEAKKADPRNGGIINSLDVYSSVNAAGKYQVRIVRSTSPTFATADGIRVGSPFMEVLRKYLHIAKLAEYALQQYSEKVALYDDEAQGISFEFKVEPDGSVAKHSRCLSVWVHEPGLQLLQEYYSPVQYLTAKTILRRAAKRAGK